MFGSWFRKEKKENNPPAFLQLGVDIHSHLIPGIDDGSKNVTDSIEMVQSLVHLGYKKLIITPHIMSDSYPNSPGTILPKLAELKRAIQEKGISVELEAAAEYYLDEVFEENLGKSELLTFGGGRKFVLVEMSYVNRPLSLESVIFKLIQLGYQPVLAHPERYSFFWGDTGFEEVKKLTERGMKLQVNLSSYVGSHSKRAAGLAESLTQSNLVDFVGTDLHNMNQLGRVVEAVGSHKGLKKLIESGRLLNSGL